jgi:hypothetical protein
MLVELHVRDLGVIADLHLVLGEGMTALTGETGAGKTLVVEAIELLVGGRADAVLVRPGAEEALVEGRFVDGDGGDGETVLARAVPRDGRSRAASALPASNWGLISTTRSAPGPTRPSRAGATVRREMNDRSATTRSKRPRSSGVR